MACILWSSFRNLEVLWRILWSRPVCIQASKNKIESWNHNDQLSKNYKLDSYQSMFASLLLLLPCKLSVDWCPLFPSFLIPTLITALGWQAILNIIFWNQWWFSHYGQRSFSHCGYVRAADYWCASNSSIRKFACTSALPILFSHFTLQLEDQLW